MRVSSQIYPIKIPLFLAGLDGLKDIFPGVGLILRLTHGLWSQHGHWETSWSHFQDGSEMELRRCQNQNDPPKMGWFENIVLNPLADHHFSIKMTILGASPIFKQRVATKLGIQSNYKNMFCTRYKWVWFHPPIILSPDRLNRSGRFCFLCFLEK